MKLQTYYSQTLSTWMQVVNPNAEDPLQKTVDLHVVFIASDLRQTRPKQMEVYHRENIIVHTGHIELFEQRD